MENYARKDISKHWRSCVSILDFFTLLAYFTALFQMKLPSKVEHFAVIASTIFATLVFAALLAANDYFSRLNFRLFNIAKAIEQSLIESDHIERIESAIKNADSLSNYYNPSWALSIFFIETIASIYLATLLSNYIG